MPAHFFLRHPKREGFLRAVHALPAARIDLVLRHRAAGDSPDGGVQARDHLGRRAGRRGDAGQRTAFHVLTQRFLGGGNVGRLARRRDEVTA